MGVATGTSCSSTLVGWPRRAPAPAQAAAQAAALPAFCQQLLPLLSRPVGVLPGLMRSRGGCPKEACAANARREAKSHAAVRATGATQVTTRWRDRKAAAGWKVVGVQGRRWEVSRKLGPREGTTPAPLGPAGSSRQQQNMPTAQALAAGPPVVPRCCATAPAQRSAAQPAGLL